MPELPNLSVGDYFISNLTSIEDIKKKHKAFILQISKKSCDECCKGEPVLNHTKYLMEQDKVKSIPIVRLDLDSYPNFETEQEIKLEKTPQIFLCLNSKYYEYTEHFNVEYFMLFLNRHLYPVVLLKTKEDIEIFRDVSKQWKENTPFYRNGYASFNHIYDKLGKQTHVIAFVADKSDYKDEIETLKQNALLLARRDDLRVAKVTDPKLVIYYKNKYNYKWFDEHSSNSIVLFKKKTVSDDLIHFYDLASERQSMFYWLNAASLDKFDELTGSSFKIMAHMKMPMLVAFINRENPKSRDKSIWLFNTLKRLAPTYSNWIFCYTENQYYKFKKREMGITWDEEPAIAVHNVYASFVPLYPRKALLTENNIKAFLKAIGEGKFEESLFELPDTKVSKTEDL